MGTNFYLLPSSTEGPWGLDRDDPEYHVGKRSAAGQYCWDCGVTLCKGGKARVHHGDGFYDRCPKCGQEPAEERLEDSAVGRELGFNKSKPERLTGVRGCASFSWAMPPERFAGLVGEGREFEDEYGRKMTGDDLMGAIQACAIQFEDSIGSYFS